MKAAVWYAQRDVRVVEIPEPPAPPEGSVKIKVEWCGICGSDLHEYIAGPIFIPVETPHPLTGRTAPVTLGHEFSGTIVEVGEGVSKWKVGDKVAPDACQVDWECYSCKRMNYPCCEKLAFTGLHTDGAFAEYVNVPAYTLYKVPDDMPFETAAVVEPLAVGMHAVRRAPVMAGDNVVILGGGTIGLSALQCAKAAGAAKVIVIEMAKARKDYAMKLGAYAVIDPTECDAAAEVQKMTDGLGADVAIECVGSDKTVPVAIASIRPRGIVVTAGVFEKNTPIQFNDVTFPEKEIKGSLAYNGEFATVIAMLGDGRLDANTMITGKIKLEDIIDQGFQELINNKDENIKIIVSPK
ncbi:MAG TPA: 2,3-butanediol dehydrogenase [Syntrophomonadaceae bacterium]|nr:2,3-butanediol dehydrogenase [Syntrophomonadaceae bacterium]HNX29671.1 2,3-butanediol dehydrogenase [Syntrophomonadaceae bacterium]HPR94274.1 2,3-butanediol dehydrogenase [Syntrophomonadaceae bacterium]